MSSLFAFEISLALCLQVSVVIVATACLQRWIGDAKTGCRLWTICFVSILGLVAAGVLLPHRRLAAFPGFLSNASTLNVVAIESKLILGCSVIYVMGVLVSLFRRASRCVSLLRFLKNHCQPLSDDQIAGLPIQFDAPGSQGVSGNLPTDKFQWMVSDRIQGPFCWQLHRPTVVLPRYVIDGDEKTLRHVLLHEVEHLRTKHPMQHFLQGACSTLFWFHPAMWMAANRAELSREYLCDEVAASAEGKFAAYLRTLVQIAEHCGSVPCSEVSASTLAFGNRKSALIKRSERVVRLAQQPISARKGQMPVAIACLFLAVAIASQLWLPVNAMASTRSNWSPWPTWTADVLHDFNVNVRDFEVFDERAQLHELFGHDED